VTESGPQPGAQYTESHVPQTVVKQLRQRAVWDVAISIVLIVFTNTSFILGAIFAIFGIAFIDYCPEGCNANSAVGIQFATGAILAFVALLGSVVTIVLLVRRRRGWWVALTSLLIVVIGWIVGFLLFAAALNSR
jgi:hypothetical protein